MSDLLTRILEKKRQEVEEAKKRIPETVLRREAEGRSEPRPFLKRLEAPGPEGANIIAEIKRASPSKGLIRGDLDPSAQAQAYEKGGAAALSVLTDESFFRGSAEDLRQARSAVPLPVLRKDFILDFYQLYQAAAMGADAALLVVRAVSPEFLRDALELCREIRLDALVEVHSEKELETASEAGARLVGINNRDLTTFRTDVRHSLRISRYLDSAQTAVAESGINDRRDVEALLEGGLWNFLVGESLVRADDPAGHLAALLGGDGG